MIVRLTLPIIDTTFHFAIHSLKLALSLAIHSAYTVMARQQVHFIFYATTLILWMVLKCPSRTKITLYGNAYL